MTNQKAIEYLEMLRDEVWNEDSDGYEYAQAIDVAIESLSIKVVRCKDCKHYTKRQYMGKSLFVCNVFEWHGQPNDYCSFGERKEG